MSRYPPAHLTEYRCNPQRLGSAGNAAHQLIAWPATRRGWHYPPLPRVGMMDWQQRAGLTGLPPVARIDARHQWADDGLRNETAPAGRRRAAAQSGPTLYRMTWGGRLTNEFGPWTRGLREIFRLLRSGDCGRWAGAAAQL